MVDIRWSSEIREGVVAIQGDPILQIRESRFRVTGLFRRRSSDFVSSSAFS